MVLVRGLLLNLKCFLLSQVSGLISESIHQIDLGFLLIDVFVDTLLLLVRVVKSHVNILQLIEYNHEFISDLGGILKLIPQKYSFRSVFNLLLLRLMRQLALLLCLYGLGAVYRCRLFLRLILVRLIAYLLTVVIFISLSHQIFFYINEFLLQLCSLIDH